MTEENLPVFPVHGASYRKHCIEIIFYFLPIYQLVMVKCQQSSERHLDPRTTHIPCIVYPDNNPLPSCDRRHYGRIPKHNAIIGLSSIIGMTRGKSITSTVCATWVTHKTFVVGVMTPASVSYLRHLPDQLLQFWSNYQCYDLRVAAREWVLASSTSHNMPQSTRSSLVTLYQNRLICFVNSQLTN